MQRLLALAVFLISSLPVIAATTEEKAAAPVPTVDMVYVVIFLVLFIGAIAGFCAYYMWGGSEDKKEQK